MFSRFKLVDFFSVFYLPTEAILVLCHIFTSIFYLICIFVEYSEEFCVLFDVFEHACNHSFQFFTNSPNLLSLENIIMVELVILKVFILHWVFIFLVVLYWKYKYIWNYFTNYNCLKPPHLCLLFKNLIKMWLLYFPPLSLLPSLSSHHNSPSISFV